MNVNQTFPGRHPLRFLTIVYILWKVFLILITIASPGPGYDTSATLLDSSTNSTTLEPGAAVLTQPLLNFVRWDVVYFTHIAQYGHVYEQEWAFGAGLSNLLSSISKISPTSTLQHELPNLVLNGICLSHVAHYIAAILVFRIAQELLIDANSHPEIPLIAALLHIISPAGVFLSAPYCEAPFAASNLLGYLMFFRAMKSLRHGRAFAGALLFTGAGFVFGVATTLRSNGILSGTLYAWECFCASLSMLKSQAVAKHILQLTGLVLGGALVAAGMFIPQYYAYQEYCTNSDGNKTPWCQLTIPAIYPYVQSHYWNVGLFRYWNVNNIPLFALAAPTLLILAYSSIDSLRTTTTDRFLSSIGSSGRLLFNQSLMARIALPELVLATMALTSYHVQIITRISSGYPHWYVWLAVQICQSPKGTNTRAIVSWMVLYATIQAGLYASFLPPA